jgi:hypothetical protein
MNIFDIIQTLRSNSGHIFKMGVLKEHADNKLLQRVLKMTYDKATFTYGISMKNVERPADLGSYPLDAHTLESALDTLEQAFSTRILTGHAAKYRLEDMLRMLTPDNASVIIGIIDRDQRINMGRSNINKVFKGLIVKPLYQRCAVFTKKTRNKIDPKGSFIQLKADGTYREFIYDGTVTCNSRSGEEYDYPEINKVFMESGAPGVYHGELTVYEDGRLLTRAIGNGIIKSGDFDGYFLKLDLWDYITLEEYSDVTNKQKATTPYLDRFMRLNSMFPKVAGGYKIETIETHIVDSVAEALKYTMSWMEAGLEGGVWKDKDALFRDGTNPQQQKLKLEIDVDMRIVGFKPGSVGTKREGKVGSVEFASDDGLIKGFASGFDASTLDHMTENWDDYMNAIMSMTCNDISKSRSNEHYALMSPRFNEVRTDKTESDSLARVLQLKDGAMELS